MWMWMCLWIAFEGARCRLIEWLSVVGPRMLLHGGVCVCQIRPRPLLNQSNAFSRPVDQPTILTTRPPPPFPPNNPHPPQRITKAINRNVEMVSSARALKAGDTFSVKDIKVPSCLTLLFFFL
jgi:hypothetical protein